MLSFEPAVKLLGSLQTLLDKADGLAEGEDYAAGVLELDKVQAECNRVLDDGKRRWAVKQKEFFEYRKMGERLAEAARKDRRNGGKARRAQQGGQTKSIEQFKTELERLQTAPDESKELNDIYKEACELADGLRLRCGRQKARSRLENRREADGEHEEHGEVRRLGDSKRRRRR